MAKQQKIYSDFSGGLNDSVAQVSIKDSEVCISENADYSNEVKSFRTRKGCTVVNGDSFNAEITDMHGWSIGSKHKKCLIIDSVLYDMDADGVLTEKIAITEGATEIYPFTAFNKFYFGDGAELYVWGDFDYSSEEGTVSVASGKIVRNNHSTDGDLGHFYQALNNRGSIDLQAEDYTNAANWLDATEVENIASSVVRVLTAYDPSQAEVVKVSILSTASASGNIDVVLNDVAFTTAITAGDSINTILSKLYSTATTGWSKIRDGNSIRYTKSAVGYSATGYVDPGATGVTATYETIQNGQADDNDLAPIRKCTMFAFHTSSYRVFASGNPDDNAVYYSEIGQPAYFVSAYNKVYPSINYGIAKGITQLSESILVSYEDGWYAWDGITPLDDATWKPLNLPYGCVSHRSIAKTPYSFMFLGRNGVYVVSASILSSELVMLQGEDIIKNVTENRIDKTIASIVNPTNCRAVFYDNVYYLAYGIDSAGNTRVLKYEWGTKSFTTITGWKVNAWTYDSSNLFFASTNYVLRTNDSESDIDVETGEEKAIEFHIRTKEYPLGNPFMNKCLNLLGFIFKQPQYENADASSVNMKVLTGYTSYGYEYELDGTAVAETLVFGTTITESLVWGRDWGLIWGFREAIVKMVELTLVSNTFQIDIQNNNLNDPIILIGIGFVYEETDFVSPTIFKDEVLLT